MDRDDEWRLAKRDVTTAIVRLIRLNAQSAGMPEHREIASALRILQALDWSLNEAAPPSGSSRESNRAPLETLDECATRYLRKQAAEHGPHFSAIEKRVQASAILLSWMWQELERVSSVHDLSDFRASKAAAAQLVRDFVQHLRSTGGHHYGPIVEDLPEDFDAPERVQGVESRALQALRDLEPDNVGEAAASLVRGALVDLGYPREQARTLFRMIAVDGDPSA